MIRALVLILLLIAGPAFGQSSKVHDLATNTTNPIPAGACLYVDQNSLDTKLCANWAATLGAMLPDLSNMTATALPSAFTLPSPVLTGTVAGANTIPLSILSQIPQRTLLGNTTTGTANVGSGWTVSGTANTVASTTGTLTNGHCVDIDVNGNLVDAGAACSSGGGGGSVTSVGLSVPAASIFGVSGSPIVGAGTLGLTTTGTSGGIPYFSSGTQLATSAQMPANHAITGGGAGASPKDSKVTITVPATGSTLTIADGKTLTANSTLTLAGVDSKTLTINNTMTLAAGADSQTFTLPTATDTILGRASTDTLTNKTFDTAGTGNVFKIAGAQLTAVSGTGATVALATSPTLVTPTLGNASATSVTLAPAASSLTQALISTQSGHGTQTSGQEIAFNQITISSDDVLASGTINVVPGSTQPVFHQALSVLHTAGGANMQGGISSLDVRTIFNAATNGSNGNRNYVSSYGQMYVNASDGGSGTAQATSLGAFFGAGFVGSSFSGATNLNNLQAVEFNIGAASGSSGWLKEIITLVPLQSDVVTFTHNTFLSISGGGAGSATGISFNNYHGSQPSLTCLICAETDAAFSTTMTATTGIDLAAYTISGNAFKSNNFSVSGAGALTETLGIHTDNSLAVNKHTSPVNWGGNTYAAPATVLQFLQDQNLTTSQSAPAFVFQNDITGSGVVSLPNTSSSFWPGILMVQNSQGDGSHHAFTFTGQLEAVGSTGYNEGSGFVGTYTNVGSTNGYLSGVEVVVQDSANGGSTHWKTRLHGLIGRVAKYDTTFASTDHFNSNSLEATSEGTQPVGSVLYAYDIGGHGWDVGIDLSAASLTTAFKSTGFSVDGSGNTAVVKLTAGGPIVLKGYTVDTLPTPATGMIAYVTDAVACTFLATVVHLGSTVCPVFYDGTSWKGG